VCPAIQDLRAPARFRDASGVQARQDDVDAHSPLSESVAAEGEL
jgi:hypothetical protein